MQFKYRETEFTKARNKTNISRG